MTELQVKTNIHEKPSSESSLVPGLPRARFGREGRRPWPLAVSISGSQGPLSLLEVALIDLRLLGGVGDSFLIFSLWWFFVVWFLFFKMGVATW